MQCLARKSPRDLVVSGIDISVSGENERQLVGQFPTLNARLMSRGSYGCVQCALFTQRDNVLLPSSTILRPVGGGPGRVRTRGISLSLESQLSWQECEH